MRRMKRGKKNRGEVRNVHILLDLRYLRIPRRKGKQKSE
jgi:hypothetical protein